MKTRRLMLQYFKFMTCSTGASLSLAFTTTTSTTIRRRITSTSTSTKYLSKIRSFTQHHANANANGSANANVNAAAIEVVQQYFQGVTEKDPSKLAFYQSIVVFLFLLLNLFFWFHRRRLSTIKFLGLPEQQ